jgi:hypothetical protein
MGDSIAEIGVRRALKGGNFTWLDNLGGGSLFVFSFSKIKIPLFAYHLLRNESWLK